MVNTISDAFSDICVWIARVGSDAASAPSEASRAGVHEIAKRGVRIGWTSALDGGGVRPRMWVIRADVAEMEREAEGSM